MIHTMLSAYRQVVEVCLVMQQSIYLYSVKNQDIHQLVFNLLCDGNTRM